MTPRQTTRLLPAALFLLLPFGCAEALHDTGLAIDAAERVIRLQCPVETVPCERARLAFNASVALHGVAVVASQADDDEADMFIGQAIDSLKQLAAAVKELVHGGA
jgi:hypothetical protein